MILMPEELTAENGAKYTLIGEFHETFEHECPECEGCGMGAPCPHSQGESKCELCNGDGTIFERIPVQWTTIKEIYKRAVALLGNPESAAIAEAVAAERERCVRLVRNEGITPQVPDDPNEEAEAINAALHNAIKAIRSAAK